MSVVQVVLVLGDLMRSWMNYTKKKKPFTFFCYKIIRNSQKITTKRHQTSIERDITKTTVDCRETHTTKIHKLPTKIQKKSIKTQDRMIVYLKETELILLHRQRRTIDAENGCKGIMTKHKKLKRHKTKARTFLMFHTYLENRAFTSC